MRIEHDDAGKAGEVRDVERQQMGQAVRPHCGDVTGIVGDLAATLMVGDEL